MNDTEVLWLLKLLLKAPGKQGIPQSGVISPLLSNLCLNEVDKMLEKAKEVTRQGQWMRTECARFADDLVVLVDAHPRQAWLRKAVEKRLREEFAKLQVEVNEEKSRRVGIFQRLIASSTRVANPLPTRRLLQSPIDNSLGVERAVSPCQAPSDTLVSLR